MCPTPMSVQGLEALAVLKSNVDSVYYRYFVIVYIFLISTAGSLSISWSLAFSRAIIMDRVVLFSLILELISVLSKQDHSKV